MKRFKPEEIEQFLVVLDSFLTKKASIIIIGGTAAALAYKVTKATHDIDTWDSVQELKGAYEKAKKKTGLDISLGKSPVADAPHNFEERLIHYKPRLFKKLKVQMPEVADLILMKSIRAEENDLEAIEQMVRTKKVSADTLINRYINEMGAAIGDKRKLDLNFLSMIERCFGESVARKAAQKIKFN